ADIHSYQQRSDYHPGRGTQTFGVTSGRPHGIHRGRRGDSSGTQREPHRGRVRYLQGPYLGEHRRYGAGHPAKGRGV
ncbi:MAG: hypothetical protein, partial [Olavius algarvensis Gamma 1 endosymbiont]